MGSTDPRHPYGPAKDMGPPLPEYPPQVLEIDPSSSTSLPSPSTSVAWNSPAFAARGFGDISTYSPSGATRQVPVENHSRGTTQDPLLHWYIDNDGPWIPKSSISEVSEERYPRVLHDNRLQFQHTYPYGQRYSSDSGTYPFGVPASDSGYGTRRSEGNASVFSADAPDRDQDGQSFGIQVADFQQYPRIDEVLRQGDSHLGEWAAVPGAAICDDQSEKPFACPRCQKRVKTRSELK